MTRKRWSSRVALMGAFALAAVGTVGGAATPAGAAVHPAGSTEAIHVVAQHLDNPHGVTIGPGGHIFVAEVGNGKVGSGCKKGTESACANLSGAIARVSAAGTVTTVVHGISSLGNPGDAPGGAGLADAHVLGHYLYGVVQDDNINAHTGKESYGPSGRLLGDLVRAPVSGGRATIVASLGRYEALHNPDHGAGAGKSEPHIDSDPFGVTSYRGGLAVADAAGNDVLWVTPAGKVRTLAVLPLIKEPLGNGHFFEAQPVPTSVAVGPDGALYISELGGGANDVNDVDIMRYTPSGGLTVWARHLTMVVAIAFDRSGRMLVLEIDVAGLDDPSKGLPEHGALIRIARDKKRTLLAGAGLEFPLGVAVSRTGAIYVTNFGVLPSEGGPIPGASGELVRIG